MEKVSEKEMAPALISNKLHKVNKNSDITGSDTVKTNGNHTEEEKFHWKEDFGAVANGDLIAINTVKALKKGLESSKLESSETDPVIHDIKMKENHKNLNGDLPTESKVNGGTGHQALPTDGENSIEELETGQMDMSDDMEAILTNNLPSIFPPSTVINQEEVTCNNDNTKLSTSTSVTMETPVEQSGGFRDQLCSLLGSNAPLVTDKLANTLQELAASLAGANSPMKDNKTSNHLNLFPPISPQVEIDPNVKKRKQQQQKLEMAQEMEKVVTNKLKTVQNKLLKSRCCMVNSVARDQLRKISNFQYSKISAKKLSKQDKKTKQNISSLMTPNKLTTIENDQNGKLPIPKNSISTPTSGTKENLTKKLTVGQEDNSKIDTTLYETAIENTEYLTDVVSFVRSGHDDYATDSSSDDEVTLLPDKSTKIAKDTRAAASSSTWMTKRVNVSRKWTWLQTQIADLETQINLVSELRKHAINKKNGQWFLREQSQLKNTTSDELASTARALPVNSSKRRRIIKVKDHQNLIKETTRTAPTKCEMCGEDLQRIVGGTRACPFNGRFHQSLCSFPKPNSNHCYLQNHKDASLSHRLAASMTVKSVWNSLLNKDVKDGVSSTARKSQRNSTKQEYIPRKRKNRASQKIRTTSLSSLGPHEDTQPQDNLHRPSYSSLDLDSEPRGTPLSSRSASRCATPTMDLLHSRKKRPYDQSSYDIDNIVIPHGVTISRIEKLHYKEILTPSWRELPDTTPPVPSEATPTHVQPTVEDDSDSAFQLKHDKYEILEKKKFITYLSMTDNKKAHASRTSISAAVNEYLEKRPGRELPLRPPLTPTSPELATPKSRSRRTSSDSLPPGFTPTNQSQDVTPDTMVHVTPTTVPPTVHLHDFKKALQPTNKNVPPIPTMSAPCWDRRKFPLGGVDLDHLNTDVHVNYCNLQHAVGKAEDILIGYDATPISNHRRRTSRNSNANDGDFSDGSVGSTASSARKRKRKRTLSRANSDSTKSNQAYDRVSITLERLADSLHQRNSGDNSDSSDSDTMSSASEFDAGNIINDSEDPEWKFF